MDLPKKSNIVGDYRFWKESLGDFSKEGNDLTIAGNPWFQNTGGKSALMRGSRADRISKSSPSGYDGMTGFTIIGYFPETKLGTDHFPNGRICSKRSVGVGDMTFDFGMGWFSGFGYFIELDSYNDTTVSYMQISTNFLANNRTVCGVLENGKKPQFYAGGVYIGEGDSAESVRNTNDDLYIQSIFSGTGMESPHGLMGLLIWNKALTAAEVAQAEEWILAQHTPSYSKRNFVVLPKITGHEKDLAFALDMDITNGKVYDKSGNGVHGTVVDGTTQENKHGFRTLKCDSAGGSRDTGLVFGEQGIPDGEFAIEILAYVTDASIYSIWLDNGGGGVYANTGYLLWSYPNGTLELLGADGTAGSYALQLTSPTGTITNGWNHIVIYYDGTTNANGAEMYINGTRVATATAARTFTGATYDLLMGQAQGLTWAGSENNFAYFNCWSGKPTSDLTTLYDNFKNKPYFVDDFDDYNESVANVTSGFLENSQWEVITGTWKITHRTDKLRGKQIQCIADGKLRYKGFTDADLMTTKEFETISGTPTLTKNSTNLEIDAVAGEKVGKVHLTFG